MSAQDRIAEALAVRMRQLDDQDIVFTLDRLARELAETVAALPDVAIVELAQPTPDGDGSVHWLAHSGFGADSYFPVAYGRVGDTIGNDLSIQEARSTAIALLSAASASEAFS